MSVAKFSEYRSKYGTFRGFCLDLKRVIDKWGYKAEDYVTIFISKETAEMLDRVCGMTEDEKLTPYEMKLTIFNMPMMVVEQEEDFRAVVKFDFEPSDVEN